jgi:stearoyl-CoA desaturase (delta-9 desaturase)
MGRLDSSLSAGRPRTTLFLTFLGVSVPPLVLVFAVAGVGGIDLTWTDVGILAVLYVATSLGVSVGFHRLFTHRSFETTKPLRVMWAVLGSLALQGPVIGWATEHRKHHAYSDREGDPHSPHIWPGGGLHRRVAGLWHAHIGWFFTTKGHAEGREFSADLLQDTAIRRVDRLYPLWVVATFGLPFLAGLVLIGGVSGALQALVWGGFVRVLLYHHATWSVNSICHSFGDRPYMARDESRNNWAVAVFTMGEGWHNNHHAFPGSAVLGFDRGQFDPGALVVRGLEKIGLVWDVNCPDSEQRARRRRTPAPTEADERPAF